MPKRTTRPDILKEGVDSEKEKKSKTTTPKRGSQSQRSSPSNLKRTPTPNKSSPSYNIRDFFLTGKLSKSKETSSPTSNGHDSPDICMVEFDQKVEIHEESNGLSEVYIDTQDTEVSLTDSVSLVETPNSFVTATEDSQSTVNSESQPTPTSIYNSNIHIDISATASGQDNLEEFKISDSGRKEYYAESFDNILNVVMGNERCLFTSEEIHIVDNYRNMDVATRYLFIRLFMRNAGMLANY
ncbi:hypothetical protein K7432_009933 [Basidiobolus ranarum]|uniref:Uncharacterized protein n=1 Tax=Basidiobolus ranarum TaxID=34480 RepID=A0ABR2VWB5_9FUNG